MTYTLEQVLDKVSQLNLRDGIDVFYFTKKPLKSADHNPLYMQTTTIAPDLYRVSMAQDFRLVPALGTPTNIIAEYIDGDIHAFDAMRLADTDTYEITQHNLER